MPPKVKVTKEDIIHAAVDIVRNGGAQAINARTIASVLNCSTQPVFSNFATMDKLQQAVITAAYDRYLGFLKSEVESGRYPQYKAFGMAYIRFAKEEKELFKLLFMRDRTEEDADKVVDFGELMDTVVQPSTGLKGQDAELFHLEMWAYVHGIATMFATGFLDLDWELVSRMLTDAYMGMRKQYGME